MDSRTISKPTSTSNRGASECPRAKPLLVGIEHVPETHEAMFRELVQKAGCRLYEAPADARPGSFVIAGSADAIAALRIGLLRTQGLEFARESVDELLADAAEADPLPLKPAETMQTCDVATEIAVPRGTTLLVSREVSFDAAHNLPRYKGKCERLHGHTYRVQVTVKAALDAWSGMAFDFHDLKKAMETRIVQVLDHAYVNEFIPNPSAEYIAIWIWDRLSDLPLHEIKVWETPTCLVTYHGPPSQEGA